jgi:hypothetical protein
LTSFFGGKEWYDGEIWSFFNSFGGMLSSVDGRVARDDGDGNGLVDGDMGLAAADKDTSCSTELHCIAFAMKGPG